MNRTRRICWLLTICLTFALLLPCALLPVSAADSGVTITETVNIAQANKNMEGHGYSWANRYDILTLDGIRLDTASDYGLRLPKNCTVILEGDNYITAAKYALSCAGTVVFKGDGKLTLEAGEIGMYLYAEDGTQKVRLLDGTYEIHAGDYGVYSIASDFSFVDGSMSITVDNAEGAAVSGRIVNLLGGSFKADNAVEASHMLIVDGVDLDVTAPRAAFSSKNLTVEDIALTSGGSAIEAYTDQTQISGKSTAKDVRPSVIFGENVSGVVDYICLVLVIAGIAALIVIPVLRARKKKAALLARLEQENPDAAAVLKR
ncbi:MAG: hypothetical protein IJX14_07435 [Clostridia bacterium]|nr:hypothetical protein [Clostridia bacterium]